MSDEANYDEFELLKGHFRYRDIVWPRDDHVVRRTFGIGSGQRASALLWGASDPKVVLLHGGGQNAHTWDAVAMALDEPLIAIDLPGHGHSDWRDDHYYGARPNADAVAAVMSQAATNADVVVGMSLGGQTSIRLAAQYPELVRRLVVVDTTPARRQDRAPLTAEQRGATLLFEGPGIFNSFDEILQTTAATVPNRPIESLRPGVLHNSRRLEDGRWMWRYDRERTGVMQDWELLWDDLAVIRVPVMLVAGGKSGRVLEEDVKEFLLRQPEARIEFVEGAGHSVQSDRPLELAELIKDFVATT